MKKLILILASCLFSSCISIYIKQPEKQENKELQLYLDSVIIRYEKELNFSDSEQLEKLQQAGDEASKKAHEKIKK
jgi:hypothetical protein